MGADFLKMGRFVIDIGIFLVNLKVVLTHVPKATTFAKETAVSNLAFPD